MYTVLEAKTEYKRTSIACYFEFGGIRGREVVEVPSGGFSAFVEAKEAFHVFCENSGAVTTETGNAWRQVIFRNAPKLLYLSRLD